MDPIVPPPLLGGSLWDTLRNEDVNHLLPKNQGTFEVILRQQNLQTFPDCVGIAGVALSVIP